MNPDYHRDMAEAKREFEYHYGKVDFVSQKSTKEILDDIDIKEIEKYLRKKKLENLKNKK